MNQMPRRRWVRVSLATLFVVPMISGTAFVAADDAALQVSDVVPPTAKTIAVPANASTAREFVNAINSESETTVLRWPYRGPLENEKVAPLDAPPLFWEVVGHLLASLNAQLTFDWQGGFTLSATNQRMLGYTATQTYLLAIQKSADQQDQSTSANHPVRLVLHYHPWDIASPSITNIRVDNGAEKGKEVKGRVVRNKAAVLSVELTIPANEIEMISAVEVDMIWQRREDFSRIRTRFGESSSATHHGRTVRSVVGKGSPEEADVAEQVVFIEWDSGLAEQDHKTADRLMTKDLQQSLSKIPSLSKQETAQLDEFMRRAVVISLVDHTVTDGLGKSVPHGASGRESSLGPLRFRATVSRQKAKDATLDVIVGKKTKQKVSSVIKVSLSKDKAQESPSRK